MPKEINWEQQTKRDFDPVQLWNEAMYNNNKEELTLSDVVTRMQERDREREKNKGG